jgi:hypothetical protein
VLRPLLYRAVSNLPENSILFSSFSFNTSSSQQQPLLTVGGTLQSVYAAYEGYPGGYIRPPCATRGIGVKSDSPVSPTQLCSCATAAAKYLQGQYGVSVHSCGMRKLSHFVSLLPRGFSTFCSIPTDTIFCPPADNEVVTPSQCLPGSLREIAPSRWGPDGPRKEGMLRWQISA